jgi:hypothetical protein
MSGRYVVWQPENGQTDEDGMKLMAFDAEHAAQLWAERDDHRSAEHHIVGGQPATVMVRNIDTAEVSEWVVSGEVEYRYTARQCIPQEPTK